MTSKPRFLKYSTRLLSTLTPIGSVVTKITLEKATSKQGKPYVLFNFEAVGMLTQEEAERRKHSASSSWRSSMRPQLLPDASRGWLR
ncbi:MAG: hypothetical protein ACLUJG_11035 [Lawsonibacter sp.]